MDKADKLLDKELFLKFTNKEKAEYINLIAIHRNGRETIIMMQMITKKSLTL